MGLAWPSQDSLEAILSVQQGWKTQSHETGQHCLHHMPAASWQCIWLPQSHGKDKEKPTNVEMEKSREATLSQWSPGVWLWCSLCGGGGFLVPAGGSQGKQR